MPFSKFIEKVNLVKISYLLFLFDPPRRLNPWRPSPPFRGRAVGLWEFIQGFEGRTPLAILRMALSPKGACD